MSSPTPSENRRTVSSSSLLFLVAAPMLALGLTQTACKCTPWEGEQGLGSKTGSKALSQEQIDELARQAAPKTIPAGMAYIAGGKTFMGCAPAADKLCQSDERPRHSIALSPYFIDVHEATVTDYRRCLEAGGCKEPAIVHKADHPVDKDCNWGREGAEEHPINCVNFAEAENFCAWQNKRLPTEAEWERAAAGPEGLVFPWGHTPPDCNRAHMQDESSHGCGTGLTSEVGSHPMGASAEGIEDLAGNVWEWVANLYGSQDYDYQRGLDPKGPKEGKLRVKRGGSFTSKMRNLRTSNRDYADPTIGYRAVGMRCVVSRAKFEAGGVKPVAAAHKNAPTKPNPPTEPNKAAKQ